MEFLARLEQHIPDTVDDATLQSVKAAERQRGEELAASGRLRRIWRVPGRRAVIALYEVESIDELHDTIASLPLFPWLDVEITPLGTHALDAYTVPSANS